MARINSGLARVLWCTLASLGAGASHLSAQTAPRDFAVELTATASEAPPAIILNWRGDTNATRYSISKKLFTDAAWNSLATVDGSTTSYRDEAVSIGSAYEYQVVKSTSVGYAGYGYICAGIKRDLVEHRGTIILIVEKSLAAPLDLELALLQQDLVGDGWTVLRHDVGVSDQVTAVKDLIVSDYNADPQNVRSVFLFGHVPVPYSGDIAPDGHPNHQGAWPADVYYGEVSGTWTDISVTSTNSAWDVNWNVPGDGKFDQSVPPKPVRLAVGRVDLSNLTCFSNKTPPRYEVDLARQYLAKDHAFRHSLFTVQKRGLVFDTRGLSEQDPLSGMAWRGFPTMFGSDQIFPCDWDKYFTTLESNSYLWSFSCSGGSQIGSDGVGSSDDFALHNPQVVFTSFFGSYFGDWNRESNFLRAALGTGGDILTSVYGGQPEWMIHPMALGETIGQCAVLTQNNTKDGIYPPQIDFGYGEVHTALLGDPTLRLHPFVPAQSVSANIDNKGAHLSWTASTEAGILGYLVYKLNSTGNYERISGSGAVAESTFLDPNGTAEDRYMVRAIRMEQSPSGSYLNLSQGAFYPDTVQERMAGQVPPAPVLGLQSVNTNGVSIKWVEPASGITTFVIQRSPLDVNTFADIATVPGSQMEYTDSSVKSGAYSYRVRAMIGSAASEYSNEARASFDSGSAEFIGIDSDTRGNWKTAYGSSGYMIPNYVTNLPPNVQMTTSNVFSYTVGYSQDNSSYLFLPDSDWRFFGTWLGGEYRPFDVTFTFNDTAVHRLAIYLYENGDNIRKQRLEAYDPITGVLLASGQVDQMGEGKYLILDVRRTVRLHMVLLAGPNAILDGIFFSDPVAGTPVITPPGGEFPGRTTVVMATSPQGAEIHYTVDGSDPTVSSPQYLFPFLLTSNVTIRAQAFKSGYKDSAISSAVFTNNLVAEARFVTEDATTKGDWATQYGQEAFAVMWGASKGAEFATITAQAHQSYLWSDTTTELRAIRRGPSDPMRLAACWYNPDAVDLDFTIYDTALHPLALYFMDWDRSGRIQDVTLSGPDGTALDQRRVQDFGDGKYLVWNIKGPVHVNIKHIAGNNAMINAYFIGGQILPLVSTAPPNLSINLDGDGCHIHVVGQPGQTIAVESSSDCVSWHLVDTKTLTGAIWDLNAAIESNEGLQAFRARLIP